MKKDRLRDIQALEELYKPFEERWKYLRNIIPNLQKNYVHADTNIGWLERNIPDFYKKVVPIGSMDRCYIDAALDCMICLEEIFSLYKNL